MVEATPKKQKEVQATHVSVDGGMDTVAHTYNGALIQAKRKAIVTRATMCMKLECTTLSEISQSRKTRTV